MPTSSACFEIEWYLRPFQYSGSELALTSTIGGQATAFQ
jgi:hypothetical protein